MRRDLLMSISIKSIMYSIFCYFVIFSFFHCIDYLHNNQIRFQCLYKKLFVLTFNHFLNLYSKHQDIHAYTRHPTWKPFCKFFFLFFSFSIFIFYLPSMMKHPYHIVAMIFHRHQSMNIKRNLIKIIIILMKRKKTLDILSKEKPKE